MLSVTYTSRISSLFLMAERSSGSSSGVRAATKIPITTISPRKIHLLMPSSASVLYCRRLSLSFVHSMLFFFVIVSEKSRKISEELGQLGRFGYADPIAPRFFMGKDGKIHLCCIGTGV